MFNRHRLDTNFSENLKEVIADSRKLAIHHQHGYIDVAHFAIVLLDNDETYGEGMIKSLGVEPLELRASIEKIIASEIIKQDVHTKSSIPLTKIADDVVKAASREGKNVLKLKELDIHHFWLAILRNPNITTWSAIGSDKVTYDLYLKTILARKEMYNHLSPFENKQDLGYAAWIKRKLGIK